MILFPKPYQYDAIMSLLEEPKALFADMGLGKTVIILTYIAIRKKIDPNFRALIIAPKRVCDLVWPREVTKWDHTSHLTFFRLKTKKDLESDKIYSDIVIINSEYIFPYVSTLSDVCNCLIVDESTAFKNYSSKRFKTLKPLLNKFTYRVILSGTPMPRSYLDLFSQFYILDSGKLLSPYLTAYRKTYFDEKICGHGPIKYYEYSLKTGADERIKNIISPKTIRIENSHRPDMPKLIYNDIAVCLDNKSQAKYDKLERHLILESKDNTMYIDSASVGFIRCHQFANGIYYDDAGLDVLEHEFKISALQELVDSLQGSPLLIAYWYKSDLRMLKKCFKNLQVFGTSDKEDARIEQEWNAGNILVLAGHPRAIGHGLNLQYGGHHIAWFSMCSNFESYEQFNGRLSRPGNSSDVVVHHIVTIKTVDEVILASTKTKGLAQSDLLSYLANKNKEQ